MLAWILLAWYVVIVGVSLLGFICILLRFNSRPIQAGLPAYEGVTIIRPIKGIDPQLTACLELSFTQKYPRDKLQILMCLYEESDPALPTLQMLVSKYPDVDASILIGADYFGPNPKVNNLAKGFAEAKFDLLWIMDLNVYALPNILLNSVDAFTANSNCGWRLSGKRRVKLVHHVPLAISVNEKGTGLLLDEMFLFTLHSKFYVALNNLAIAPCVNGKSNLYRKSDLHHAVASIPGHELKFFTEQLVKSEAARLADTSAIGFFSRYIGEDNMIAIAIWDFCCGRPALTGDVVIQPLESTHDNSIKEYVNRRVRWLRVRKYMVFAATLVEPTTESIVCGVMGTLGVSLLFMDRWFLPWFFAFHMAVWFFIDYTQYYTLVGSIDGLGTTQPWLYEIGAKRRSVLLWARYWALREILALPIWIQAMVGHEIEWRGRPLRIKRDLTAEEI